MSVPWVVLFALLMQGGAGQGEGQTGSVTGYVRDGAKAGLEKAELEMTAVTPGARGAASERSYLAVTGADGRFSFTGVPPGEYHLVASRTGYVTAEYPKRPESGLWPTMTVSSGSGSDPVMLRLWPSGAISGTVTDGFGMPLGNADVEAKKITYQQGKRVLSVVQSTRTDDLGNYRLFWLPPGRYYIDAIPANGPNAGVIVMNGAGTDSGLSRNRSQLRNVMSRSVGSGAPAGEAFVPVYFPQEPAPDTASILTIRPGCYAAA